MNMISTVPRQPPPHQELRFVADGLFTKEGEVTVFIYYHMESSTHTTCEHINSRDLDSSSCPSGQLE